MNKETVSITSMHSSFCSFKQKNTMSRSYIDPPSASFIFFAVISTSSSNTYPWSAALFMVFTLISIS